MSEIITPQLNQTTGAIEYAHADAMQIEDRTDSEELEISTEGAAKKTVTDYLNEVDYAYANSAEYVPTQFALKFVNMIKYINYPQGEENSNPPVHLQMLDGLTGSRERIVNLCWRGSAKTTLMYEYLVLYLALYNTLPGFGLVESMIFVTDSMDGGVKTGKKNIEDRYNKSEFLQKYIYPPKFTDGYMEFHNIRGGRLGVRSFGAQSTIRGIKMFGKRPNLAVLDELVKDEDANSPLIMEKINDTIYKAVEPALHPKRSKIILSGTPFNRMDPVSQAVESGAWHVNAFPLCEKFPCTRAEYERTSAWPERFPYEKQVKRYNAFLAAGRISSFRQEYMLQITSDEERLVQDGEILWYTKEKLMPNLDSYNIYITTDFAFSEKQKADYSVISVWAHSYTGQWFWLDGMCERQTIDKSLNKLFSLVQDYKPQTVGIEVSGQQVILLDWIRDLALKAKVNFSFAFQNGKPGLRPIGNKLSRFQLMVPYFKRGDILFPRELKETFIMQEFTDEITLATHSGLKGKNDDCLDTISMLANMNAQKPSGTESGNRSRDGIWGLPNMDNHASPISSYLG